MRLKSLACACLLVLSGAAGAPAQQPDSGSAFPHRRHDRLFPMCTGCHDVTGAGTRAALYPAAESCAACHDGATRPTVSWLPSRRSAGHFFRHEKHTDRGGTLLGTCTDCHGTPGEPAMAVRRLAVERCLQCHVHDPKNAQPVAASATP